jgi:hypothetical protein
MSTLRYYDISASQRPSPKGYKPKNLSSSQDGPEDRETSLTIGHWKKTPLPEQMRATPKSRQDNGHHLSTDSILPEP